MASPSYTDIEVVPGVSVSDSIIASPRKIALLLAECLDDEADVEALRLLMLLLRIPEEALPPSDTEVRAATGELYCIGLDDSIRDGDDSDMTDEGIDEDEESEDNDDIALPMYASLEGEDEPVTWGAIKNNVVNTKYALPIDSGKGDDGVVDVIADGESGSIGISCMVQSVWLVVYLIYSYY